MLSTRHLTDRFGVHVSTVWRWRRDPAIAFPAPIWLGPNSPRWRERDVLEWEQRRAAQTDVHSVEPR